ncbi:hypothetical protein LZC95_08385 [Pendulispora brunnea]|uniref:Uncharacterized protein n=1 Tax=Pendulispora brunnea TaxID=2905690 RepID=A0ABZ2KDS8_9BACT
MLGAYAFDLEFPVWFSHSASHDRDLYAVVDPAALPAIHLTDIRPASALRPLEDPYFVKTLMVRDGRFRAIQRAFGLAGQGAVGELRLNRERVPIVMLAHGSGFHLGAPLVRRLNLPSDATGYTQARVHMSGEILSKLATKAAYEPETGRVVDLSDLFHWMRAIRRPVADEDNDVTGVRQIGVQRQNDAPPDTHRVPNTTREGR